MQNYKLLVEYDGRDFLGWQRQKYTDNTIQETLETALSRLLKEDIKLTVAGRTDSGVSALNQVANFYYAGKISSGNFIYSINSILPGSVTVKKLSKVPADFHARYSALKREYIYRISLGKRSISGEYYYIIRTMPDLKKIDRFISYVRKLDSFKAFCKNTQDRHDFRCRIDNFTCKYHPAKKEIIFKISANRFLHSMVRALVGCSLQIGRGKIELNDLKNKIIKGEKVSIHYLPAHALFLNKIYY